MGPQFEPVLENWKESKTIFQELGVKILEAEDSRDDIIIKFDERIDVMEIKGVTKSGAEKHATRYSAFVLVLRCKKKMKRKKET